MNKQAILEFIKAAGELGYHSFLLKQNDRTLAEGYWKPYSEQRPHMLFSLSKSFTSTAFGLCVEEGRCRYDDRMIDFFPEYKAKASPDAERLIMSDLLRMSCGHKSDGELLCGEDWVGNFLSEELSWEPGSQFSYNTAATYMVSSVVQKVTGMCTEDYLTPRLFEPLGIIDHYWEKCPAGHSTGGFGLNLCTRDISKFAQLYLHRGDYNGKRILSEQTVDILTSKHIDNNGAGRDWTMGYGYQFWRCQPEGVFRGDGAFGQLAIVMPEQNATMAVTAGLGDMQRELDLIWKYILPALSDGNDDFEPDDELKAALSAVEIPALSTAPGLECERLERSVHFGENIHGITGATIRLPEDPSEPGTLILDTAYGIQTLKLGAGCSELNRFEAEQQLQLPFHHMPFFSEAACSYERLSDGNLRLKLIYPRTPYTDIIDVTLGERVSVKLNRNQSFGGRTLELIGD